jgi:hypothetical protein
MPRTQQELRGAVPSRDDTIGVTPLSAARVETRAGHIRVERPCEAKISDLEVAIIRDEEISCFHVAVEDVVLCRDSREGIGEEKAKRTRCIYSVPSNNCFIYNLI